MSYPTNTFETTSLVSNTALAMFANNCPYVMTLSRVYQPEFTNTGYKIGDTIQMRRQNQFVVGNGQAIASINAVTEAVETLTIANQFNVPMSYSQQDLTLRMDDFNRIILQPAIQAIISQAEISVSNAAETQLNFFTGSTSNPINSFATIDNAGAKLLTMGVNLYSDAYLNISIPDGSALKNSFVNGGSSVFTPVFNEDIARTSSIGHISYFDAFQSQNLTTHTAGVGPVTHPTDTLTVNGAVSSGSTIILQGATASVTNYFVAGDLISIGGVQALNPINQLAIPGNMQFVITAAANSSAGGAVTITVSPSIITTGNSQNVTNAIADDAPVTVQGSHVLNVAYPMRGADIACPPLAKLEVPYFSVATDPETRLSLSVAQSADILAGVNIMRIDMLMGIQWHPQYACKVLSQANQTL